MKALWLVSFRPIGKSSSIDLNQSIFIDSIKKIRFDITFSLTQFEEKNVKEFIDNKKIKNFYINISKKQLPNNKKYSNKIMLANALNQFIENGNFEYLIYSTADIIVPNNLFEVLSKINKEEFCALIYPNIHITHGTRTNNFWPHYGIDLIVFKLKKENALKFKNSIENYNQFDWGIIENFYVSMSELLNLKIFNLFKECKVLKHDNDPKTFTEDRSWQIKSWKENQKYFLNFLNENKLSKLYAYGSYYYLLYKILNFRDLNFALTLSYIIFYPLNIFKKILNLITKNFR